jgi:hypothetical protein
MALFAASLVVVGVAHFRYYCSSIRSGLGLRPLADCSQISGHTRVGASKLCVKHDHGESISSVLVICRGDEHQAIRG